MRKYSSSSNTFRGYLLSTFSRKLYLIIIFLLYFNLFPSLSQPSYQIIFNSRNHDEVCGPVVATQEGEIFFILWSAASPNWTFNFGYSNLYKINLDGDTIKWDYQKTDTLLYYLALLYDHQGNLVIGGDAWSLDTAGNKTSKFQWFCKLTIDFQIIWQKTYRIETTGVYYQDLSSLTELPNDCYLYGNSNTPDTSYTDFTYLFKFDNSGDSVIFIHNNEELRSSILKSITIQPDSSSLTLHLYGGNPPPTYSGCKFIRYDSSFNKITDGRYYNSYYAQPFYTMNYTNDIYLSCGRYWQLQKAFDPAYYIRVQKMNEEFTVVDHIDLTYPDPEKPTYAAWYQSVDFIDPNKIFAGGMEDKNLTIWNPNPSWIYVACLDSDLDLIHEEYYGGDALYETYYVKATYDGGVILTGSMYNDSIQDHERDGFLMKFDSVLFVGTPEPIQNNSSAKVQVYPNPGQDYFTVHTSPSAMEFDLFNSLGKKIIALQKPDQIFTIPTANFPEGIYFWAVKYPDSLISSGKWIKM